MTIHKEGYTTIAITLLTLGVINYAAHAYLNEDYPNIQLAIIIVSLLLLLIVLQFFRHPNRRIKRNEKFPRGPKTLIL